jgi:hypothetical protein
MGEHNTPHSPRRSAARVGKKAKGVIARHYEDGVGFLFLAAVAAAAFAMLWLFTLETTPYSVGRSEA